MNRTPWEITREMFLSLDEVERLLDDVRHRSDMAGGRQAGAAKLDRLIVAMLLYSGVRTSELCGLTIGDTVVGLRESVLRVQGKRGQQREVHVPSSVSDLVAEYAQNTRPRFLPDDINERDLRQPLLFSERKRPYERTGLYRRVVRILTRAGLGDRASVQLLRHTYGYLAYLRTGGNLLFVQRQLGHAHPMITSVYAQFVDESYDDMAEAIAVPEASATSV